VSHRHRTLTLRAYGRTVAVAGPTDVLDIVRERLPPSYRGSDAEPQRRWRVSVRGDLWRCDNDDDQLALVDSVVTASEIVLSDLELWVAEHARRHVFVHAGCVIADGRAIVIPGRSMSGKTSLTAALIRAGASYFSDEYAVLDAHGQVRPYARRLAIRPYDGGPPHRVTAEDIGSPTGRGPRPVGLVVVLRYERAAGWDVHPLTRGQAVLQLLDNTIPARSRPRAVLTALDRATEHADCLAGTRGDADEAAEIVLRKLRNLSG
jgi:hypothetical protein